ncbi:MAG: beta strand repeat-containing protein [bacterium]
MATSTINQETNALYLGLFDRPANPGGQSFWADHSGNSPTALSSGVLTGMGNYASYVFGIANPAPLSSLNIAGEIVNIYSNLFGATVTTADKGVQYWANQWNGNGGTLSIGQIVASIYNIVENLPSTSAVYIDKETMDAKLGAMQAFTASYYSPAGPLSYASATSLLNDAYTQANFLNGTMPTSIIGAQTVNVTAAPTANFSFVGGIAEPDTMNLSAAPIANGYTYTMLGSASPANTIDVNYAATSAGLTTYLGSASNFSTLDFTVAPASPLTLDLSKVDGGGFTAVDVNGGAFTFQNAAGSAAIFNVNANTASLTISDAAGHKGANVTLNGGTAGVTLGILDASLASPAAVNPTVLNIISNGTAPNIIGTIDAANASTVNITGSDALTAAISGSGNDTLNISGSGNDTVSITGPGADTVNISGLGNDTVVIAGAGNDTVNISGPGSDSVTLGSGVDTVNMLGPGTDTFQNATNSDTFNVNANMASLIISDAAGQTAANVTLNGGTAGVTLGILDTYLASPAAVNPTTVNIISYGSSPNVIGNLDALNNPVVNIYGSDNLTIGTVTGNPTFNYAGFGGTSLIIAGVTYAPSAPSSTPPPAGSTSNPNAPLAATTVTTISPGSTTTWGVAPSDVTSYTFAIASSAASTTLTAYNGTDAVNIAGGTGANTITLGNAAAGAGNDTITSAGTGAATFTLGTTGATGNDSVTMTGGNTAQNTITITSYGIDSVTMTGHSTAGNTVTINGAGGAYADTVSMTGGNTAGNTVIIDGGSGPANVTMTGGNSGANSITISGTGINTVLVGQGNHTINLGAVSGNAGTTGIAGISIGQGTNTITLGTGTDSVNLTTIYSTTTAGVTTGAQAAGPDTLNGVITGDNLVFNHSADSANPILLTTTLGTENIVATTTIASEIATLQALDTVTGDTSVGWFNQGAAADTWVVMDHNIGSGNFVDQVIEIVGTASYLTSATVVSVNAAHLVSVAL